MDIDAKSLGFVFLYQPLDNPVQSDKLYRGNVVREQHPPGNLLADNNAAANDDQLSIVETTPRPGENLGVGEHWLIVFLGWGNANALKKAGLEGL